MSKNVIITGTSRGIGFELVQQFARQGHRILALSRNTQPVIQLKLDNVQAISFNLTLANDLKIVEDYVTKHWGHIDVLIHNAGLLINKPFAKTTTKDFLDLYRVNVFGFAELTRKLLPFIKKKGHVVSISSMGGIQGSVKFPGLSAYSSSKGAVVTLTELLAEEYKTTGPSFNALALGAVQTEMLAEAFPDYKAPLSPLEMARYICEFALNGNTYYNGKTLQVSSSTP